MPVNTTVLPAIGGIGARLLGVADAHLRGEAFDAGAVMRLAEIIAQALDHRVADLIERVHLLLGLLVVLGELETGRVEGVPAAVAARQRHRRRLADMADAERVDEPLQRNLAPRRDGVEQIAHRGFAKSFHFFEVGFFCCALAE